MSALYLPHHLRKHNCYSMTGLPLGLLYCQDMMEYNDAWGRKDLFECFTKYQVPFDKAYCDDKFGDNKYLLMQCYASKNVERGEEFCVTNFDPKTERNVFLECFEGIPLFTHTYCKIKFDNDPDAKIDCYKDKARLTLN